MFLMICYDVPSKRTEIYRKILREFLVHEQSSVFMGDLPESEVVKLMARISAKIAPDDKVMKITAPNRHNITVERLSRQAGGGPMRQEADTWHGKDWSIL